MLEFPRFLIAGGIAAAANFGSRFVFSIFFSYAFAVFLAYLVGMVVAFLLMRGHVFNASNGSLVPQVAKFFGVNVFGLVDALNTMVPALANPSSVVMMGSLYGLVSPKPALYDHFNGGQGSIKHPAYGASKAALIAIAKQYGTHLAHDGVRVNMLTLGGVAAGQDQEFVDKFVSHVPQAQMLSRNDVIGAMVFLLSDDSRAMTGQNVVVDGGFTAW